MIRSQDPTTLSELFHLNSEPWLNEDAYRAAPYHQEFKQLQSVGPRVALPPTPDTALSKLVRDRKSVRGYVRRSMPLDLLSALRQRPRAPLKVERSKVEAAPSCVGAHPLPEVSIRWRTTSSCRR